ncbi:jasmonate-zim-domain protein 8 [Tasmannia lanceolata]|uniref:jasmonate-zim-domain protein 8 n=1 Tax=Tasmannia lanceolata TaxID=3420 RepID=UPI004063DFDA
MMGRNFNLELCLLPAGANTNPNPNSNSNPDNLSSREEGSGENSQQLTIFYNGRVCACDVTELQARAILHLAKREMDQQLKTRESEPFSPLGHHAPGLSMKRSLQRFLQKRKTRIQETSPYKQ